MTFIEKKRGVFSKLTLLSLNKFVYLKLNIQRKKRSILKLKANIKAQLNDCKTEASRRKVEKIIMM